MRRVSGYFGDEGLAAVGYSNVVPGGTELLPQTTKLLLLSLKYQYG